MFSSNLGICNTISPMFASLYFLDMLIDIECDVVVIVTRCWRRHSVAHALSFFFFFSIYKNDYVLPLVFASGRCSSFGREKNRGSLSLLPSFPSLSLYPIFLFIPYGVEWFHVGNFWVTWYAFVYSWFLLSKIISQGTW